MPVLGDYAFFVALFFIIGYAFITLEHFVRIDKAATALMMAVVCWIFQFQDQAQDCDAHLSCLGEHMGNISQIIFFIIAALAVVENISGHKGFNVISDRIQTTSKRKLLWMLGFITFFLSAVLDNLTTTIVVITLLRKLIQDPKERLLYGGGVVIAANAGGAWTPIGDVTTTMLWIGGQVTADGVVISLLLPSIACLVVSFACLHFMVSGNFTNNEIREPEHSEPMGQFVFFTGVALLIFVPIFKYLTGLPPFMGMLFALGMLWIITDFIHRNFDCRTHLKFPYSLTKLDYSGVLFFLGILLAVEALNSAGILDTLAVYLNETIGNVTLIATAIGIASAVVDNVPLVAATMGMYELSTFPTDSHFWNLIALCAGTGGSILVIGSAAGVVFMGMERVNFFWYLRTISGPALLGYVAGIVTYLVIS